MVPLRNQPQHVSVRALDRVAALPVAVGEGIGRQVRGEFQTAGHGTTSFSIPSSILLLSTWTWYKMVKSPGGNNWIWKDGGMGQVQVRRLLGTVLVKFLIGLLTTQSMVIAQDDAQPTIDALETQVAELREENAALQVSGEPIPTVIASRIPHVEEPIEIADGLVILSYRFVRSGTYRADSEDKSTWVVGEIQNTTDLVLDAPGFEFLLTDGGGNVIGSISADPILQVIQPGQVMPFQSAIFGDEPDPSEWTNEEISLCTEWGSTQRLDEFDPSGLVLEDVVAEQDSSGLSLEGNVRNNREVPASNVWIKAAIYDAEGKSAGWFWTFLEVDVPAGKTARFSFNSMGDPHDPVGLAGPDYTYVLWVGPDSSFGSC